MPRDLTDLVDHLGPHLERLQLGPHLVVVEIEARGRRVGLARAVPEGEHDMVAIAIELLTDASGLLPALLAGAPLVCAP